jgi:hypothetical protein
MMRLALLLALVAGCGEPPPDGGDQDLAMAAGDDLAAPPGDLATADAPPRDLAGPARDLTVIITGCHGLVLCINGCNNDNGCIANCENAVTPTGKKFFNDLLDCLDLACPTLNPGDPCFFNDQTCAACWQKAQYTMGGACYTQAMNCQNDKP